MQEEREISYGEWFQIVAEALARGVRKGRIMLNLVQEGYDPESAAEFVDYVQKATGGSRGRRSGVSRIWAGLFRW